jgi:hypothetical protein
MMTLADATIWHFLSLSVPALLLVILGPDNQKQIHLHQIVGDYSRTSFGFCAGIDSLAFNQRALPQIVSSPTYHTTKKNLTSSSSTPMEPIFSSLRIFRFLFPSKSFGSFHVDT